MAIVAEDFIPIKKNKKFTSINEYFVYITNGKTPSDVEETCFQHSHYIQGTSLHQTNVE